MRRGRFFCLDACKAAALLAGSMATFAADQPTSEAAMGAVVGAPALAPGVCAKVPSGPAPAYMVPVPAWDQQAPTIR